MKTNNLEKFQLRGAIKEIMRNCNLRTISIANFEKWAKNNVADFLPIKNAIDCVNKDIHSVKYDIMNGYIKVYHFNDKGQAGKPFDSVDNETYSLIYNTIMDITMMNIPSKVKKNILVKVNR